MEPHKIYNLCSLSSFFTRKICFYSGKCLNGSSSGISIFSTSSMIEAFLKADLIISSEFRKLLYRLIAHISVSFLIAWYQYQFFGHFSHCSGHLLPLLRTILETAISEIILKMH